jgi:hypothetical protein
MNGYTNGNMNSEEPHYSVLRGTEEALQTLQSSTTEQLPPEFKQHLRDVNFHATSRGNSIYFPCPFKETEAAAALKSIEASAVAAITDLRYGAQHRRIHIDLASTAAFLFSTYIAKIGGLNKGDIKVKTKVKGNSTCLAAYDF